MKSFFFFCLTVGSKYCSNSQGTLYIYVFERKVFRSECVNINLEDGKKKKKKNFFLAIIQLLDNFVVCFCLSLSDLFISMFVWEQKIYFIKFVSYVSSLCENNLGLKT